MRPFLFCLLFVALVLTSATVTEARPRLLGRAACGVAHAAQRINEARPRLLARSVTVIRNREVRPLQRAFGGCAGRGGRCSG